ncbi:putative Acidic endochitinase SP2 [Hypsibius exemplaris]|uniref:Acidic endochitinase SP2 n=1 Tax=Hypsibius exemplaris TaxID=2072580 RepID=A0A1W0WMH0_HYPEX|nr:putative Acidic endochitinase SP2 [Hypsibius exemplaris]
MTMESVIVFCFGFFTLICGSSYAALITKAELTAALTSSGFPAPSDEQYKNIVTRCEKSGKITTKRELAMFLANVFQESDGLRAKKEYNPPAGAYQAPGGAPGKRYYGRGYLQLSWVYNYKAASQALYKDDRLVKDPDQVATKDDVAWDTAFWYWSANVHSAPGVSEGKFGATTKAINGALECGGAAVGTEQAKRRFEFYKKISAAFKLSGKPVENGCYN